MRLPVLARTLLNTVAVTLTLPGMHNNAVTVPGYPGSAQTGRNEVPNPVLSKITCEIETTTRGPRYRSPDTSCARATVPPSVLSRYAYPRMAYLVHLGQFGEKKHLSNVFFGVTVVNIKCFRSCARTLGTRAHCRTFLPGKRG